MTRENEYGAQIDDDGDPILGKSAYCVHCGTIRPVSDLGYVSGSHGHWEEGYYCQFCSEKRGAEEEAAAAGRQGNRMTPLEAAIRRAEEAEAALARCVADHHELARAIREHWEEAKLAGLRACDQRLFEKYWMATEGRLPPYEHMAGGDPGLIRR